ncbi:MAG: hypothetical protein GEU88_11240 [Solirubrobacterales bacterium]|nr:hypothetical protein [Solirubrobacterales bacterium]
MLVATAGALIALTAPAAGDDRPPKAGGGAQGSKPAAPGKYVGEIDGNEVKLKVNRAGRFMDGWVGRLRLKCGGYPGLPTYPTVAMDFPRTRIGDDGRLRRTWHGNGGGDEADDFTMKMEVRFAGKRARKGHVSYAGPGRCFGSADWTARLKR